VRTRFSTPPDRGVELAPHPHLESRGPRKRRVITLLTLRAFVAYEKGEKLPTSIPEDGRTDRNM